MLTEYQKNHPYKAAFKSAFTIDRIMFYLLFILVMAFGRLNVQNIELNERNIKLEKSINEIRNKYMDMKREIKKNE